MDNQTPEPPPARGARMSSCCVLVTPTSFGKGEPRLVAELEAAVGKVVYNQTGHPLSSAELGALLPGCHGMIAGLDSIDRSALDAADSLRVIARYGAGVDRVDLAATAKRVWWLTNTPSANAVSVAELTIGLMLASPRDICGRQCRRPRRRLAPLDGVTLQGKVIGLLGLGAVGGQVARRLHGWDCTVVAYDPYVDGKFAAAWGVAMLSFGEVVHTANSSRSTCPRCLGQGVVNADFLAKIKRGAFLVNAAAASSSMRRPCSPPCRAATCTAPRLMPSPPSRRALTTLSFPCPR